ncbi:MAG: RluA family pseudouridine synthase [Ardenticatenia bacterium]|nr:MAG: RluA family pseudouridine synthase [Ardenticatenia bacterium]
MLQDHQVIQLKIDRSGERLDRHLARVLPELSRSRIQQLIRAGLVTVNDKPTKPGMFVEAGMQVTLRIPPSPSETPLEAQPFPLDIVYEDDALLVIAKPAGLVVHPGAGHSHDTLVNALLAYCPTLATDESNRPGIVHRLDRDTSGLLIVAKTERALEHLRAQFKQHRVQKTYLALVYGRPPTPQGIIEAPVGRDPHHRQRMAIISGGRAARTAYQQMASLGDYTLLRVSPETGRTHQIRVHLAWLGIPVAGDRVYGRRREQVAMPRQFLHAWQLSFEHPSGIRLSLKAPLPADLRAVLDALARRYSVDNKEIAQLLGE